MTNEEAKQQLGLVWREGKPTEPGDYWLDTGTQGVTHAHVYKDDAKGLYFYDDDNDKMFVKVWIKRYCPIPEPMDPPKPEDVLWEEKGFGWYRRQATSKPGAIYKQAVRDALEWVEQQKEKGELC